MNFKPIPRWRKKLSHIRNIGIASHVAQGKSYVEVGRIYNLSSTRVSQIYRITAAFLCERRLGVKFIEAIYDKRYYKHFQMPKFIWEYQKDYINWVDNLPM
jgi:hypothetical protein